jgi:hypothetical protein
VMLAAGSSSTLVVLDDRSRLAIRVQQDSAGGKARRGRPRRYRAAVPLVTGCVAGVGRHRAATRPGLAGQAPPVPLGSPRGRVFGEAPTPTGPPRATDPLCSRS